MPSPAAIRETIESVVVAFVLAFLFRTFEAEAFVIPTGSMAPTLMGRHKDLRCPICDYPFQVSASDEVDGNGVPRNPPAWVEGCTCPMCRYTMYLGPNNPQEKTYRSFKGDRILVGKFCYQFGEPDRWDVAVFKYPVEANTNFIKRLVGLPGETIRIQHGDIFVKERGDDDFVIARKALDKLLAMLQPVFDNEYMPKIIERGWPARWRRWPSPKGSSPGDWKTSEDYRSFKTDGTAAREVWLRYEHRVQAWEAPPSGGPPPDPQLISDFCAYNTGRNGARRQYGQGLDRGGSEPNWVGDLALDCTLEVLSDSGQAVFELVEGGRRFQCRVDVATGVAALSIEGLDSFGPEASTDVRGPGSYRIMFSNVDDELMLWVDRSVVQFDAPTSYGRLKNTQHQAADRAPVGIASRGAPLRVSHLKLFRDVYYIAERYPSGNGMNDDPNGVEFRLGPDQFLVLGDNSAKSKDSRLWGKEEYYVSRELLIGKALYIYWPHSWNKLPGTKIPFPFFPNFPRMRFVR